MQPKKTIFLLLPTGMTIRNLLSTTIVKDILENSQHQIICCVKNAEKYQSYFAHKRIKYINFIEKQAFSFSNIILLILRMRFYAIKQNETLKILDDNPLSLSFKDKLVSYLKYPFPKNRRIYNFLSSIQGFVHFQRREIELQFSKHKPDVVFSTHLVARDEYDYLMEAKRRKIPTIGMVKSFDNLTAKGFLPYKTDFVILWNNIMQEELINIYKYDKKKIKVTGVPQFDIYKKKPNVSREFFFKQHNLSKNKKTILYATNHKNLGPDDRENVEYLSSKLRQLNAQMIVRLHQMDTIDRYNNLVLDDVHFQVPGIVEGYGSNERVAHKDFLEGLRDTIYFSDITINTCSTMSLDAVAIDKPIINIAFDNSKKPYNKSVKRFYDFVHYQPIILSRATSIARSKNELINLIELYIKNHNHKKSEREELRQVMLLGNQGNASEQVARGVLEIMGRLFS